MLVYNSRDPLCKSPFGAVPTSREILLHARCDEPLTLVLYRDYTPWQRLPFSGDTLHLRVEVPQVYWYFFETPTRRYYRDVDTNRPVEASEGATWQLTVYDPDYHSPDWLPGGVICQVFPDRFACSGRPKTGVPADRVLHRSLQELPDPPEPPDRAPCSDYFGGDLAGIREQLGRLTALGANVLYLNPIFEAHSNHRYNTADYQKLDPMLGTEDDLRGLICAAREQGVRTVLDGVFSHVGADSVYMNRYGRYGETGAYKDADSPFREWFTFRPDGSYQCWWNIPSLPEVDENCPSFRAEVERAVRKWESLGIGGWRLDVADELPDPFIVWLRTLLRSLDPEGYLLGEVWEDATTKQREAVRREYLLGHELDGVMNYPWRTAILDWVLQGDGSLFRERIESVCENYPPPALRCLMNLLGTHDTPRLLSVLGGDDLSALSRPAARAYRMTPEQRSLAVLRELPALALQYALPGLPSVYYGDEQCMEGAGDPYCRGFYSEAGRDDTLYNAYRALGALRRAHPCFRDGPARVERAEKDLAVLTRENGGERLTVAVNRTGEVLPLPTEGSVAFAVRADAKGLGPYGARYTLEPSGAE